MSEEVGRRIHIEMALSQGRSAVGEGCDRKRRCGVRSSRDAELGRASWEAARRRAKLTAHGAGERQLLLLLII